MNSVEIEIHPCDYLNPGFGYEVKVTVNGESVLWTNKHPVSKKDLDLASAIEVANIFSSEQNWIRRPDGLSQYVGAWMPRRSKRQSKT